MVSGAGCTANECVKPSVELIDLGLRWPSEALQHVAQDTPLKDYKVVVSSKYFAFAKTANAPLDFDAITNVRFDFGSGQYEFDLSLVGPPPPFWADEVVVRKRTDLSQQVVELPKQSQLAFPTWSPDGRLLAFVVRQRNDLRLGVYSPENDVLTLTKKGNLSLWILGQMSERGSPSGDIAAPFYWSDDSKHIFFGRRTHARRFDVDILKAVALPIGASTDRISLNEDWRRYLMESEIVKADVKLSGEHLISTPDLYRHLIPLGEGNDLFVSTFPRNDESSVRVLKIEGSGIGSPAEIAMSKSLGPSNIRIFASKAGEHGVFMWTNEVLSSGESSSCFFFATYRDLAAGEYLCINDGNRINQIWRRGGYFVVNESSDDTNKMRVVDARNGATVDLVSMHDELIEDIGLQCSDYIWWPAPTSSLQSEELDPRAVGVLMSTTCGRQFVFETLSALWINEVGSEKPKRLLAQDEDALLAAAHRLSRHLILLLREGVGEEPGFCVYNLKTAECSEVELKARSLDLDRFERLELSGVRDDGWLLRGTLLLPSSTHQAVEGRLPTIIWQYPHQVSGTEKFVPGDFGKSYVDYTLAHQSAYIAQWLPTAFLELGIAVLVYPDWPYFGVYGDGENELYEDQLAMNLNTYLSALSKTGVVDMTRVGIAGHSKGGNEALLAAALNSRITFSMAFAPGVNLTDNPAAHQFERRSYWEVPQHYLEMSPMLRVNDISQPILVIHSMGDRNHLSPPQVTRSFDLALSRLGKRKLATTILLPNGSHVFGTREERSHTLFEVERWLESVLNDLDQKADETKH